MGFGQNQNLSRGGLDRRTWSCRDPPQRDRNSFHFHDTTTAKSKMTSHRGNSRVRERVEGPAVATNHHRQVTSPPSHRVLRKTQQGKNREILSPCRSCAPGSDNVSLETEGTGISTLTSSTGGERRRHHQQQRQQLPGNSLLHKMPPALYTHTIPEDELQSRATQSSYISRPIDVDSMEEYDEDEELKPTRLNLDDSRSHSSFSSRPIDVDSMTEYEPEDFPESDVPQERFEKIMNFGNGYYEGESLLQYSSSDEEVDFDTGLVADSRKGRPERSVASLKTLPVSPKPATMTRSVDVVGPIRLDTNYILADDDEESAVEISFQDWEFPIVEDTFDRELVGYIEGFEPFVEDLTPHHSAAGRKPSDATSTRSSHTPRSISTRVTFEI